MHTADVLRAAQARRPSYLLALGRRIKGSVQEEARCCTIHPKGKGPETLANASIAAADPFGAFVDSRRFGSEQGNIGWDEGARRERRGLIRLTSQMEPFLNTNMRP